MWEFAIRFPFGQRSAPLHNEEILDAPTTKNLLKQEGASHKMADSSHTSSSNYEDVANGHHSHRATTEHVTSAPNPPFASPNEASLAIIRPSSIDIQSPTKLNTSMARWSFESERHKFHAKQKLLHEVYPHDESDGSRLTTNIEHPINKLSSEAKLVMEAEQFAQSATHLTLTAPEHTEMGNLLAPVLRNLKSLNTMTLESLPPYNPFLRVKRYLQILKTRLLPVGEHILHILAGIFEEKRGLLELKLCRHIAVKHWPLPLEATTHLRIQETYRNDMSKTSFQKQAESLNDMRASTSGNEQSSTEAQEGASKLLPDPSDRSSSDD